ncbi:glycoside hydrolase family 10 protein [Mucilaginibacter sp. KACC 22063]|uniref:glycoside hydrolase family 10 protein n=1 Tax=Mucilaginibacter sp. KACC 22063 TaxID=3025666 RepID=UPI002366A114|nr:family 10 glycosylhydrolase [Mucilaginibacter sp. KACC 22063]WDF55544.1 family 10 glycosylhydrolase [Mucilaginibacter sp. KACC 22063]
MCKVKGLISTLFFVLFVLNLHAQSTIIIPPQKAPKREFRGVWVATVVNIDWPSAVGLSTQKQQQQLIRILDFHQQTNMNAVMFQVRPAADAFYSRGREPWSRWITGRQGKAPEPFYDPLDFAITEAHKRGMELHAWVNPYRATFDNNYSNIAPNHPTRTHPEWFFVYGGQKLFNPGLPEVREYIIQVILDIVKNYDIDGIHMDDYFYPYLIAGQTIHDEAAFRQYGADFTDIRDWRRNNVDLLIKALGDSIHKYKPNIKWGVSPRGVWRNHDEDIEGSMTHGGPSYSENYADTRKWLKEGWIDYLVPQVYWQIGNRSAGFDVLTDWWSQQTNGHHLYIGMAPYRMAEARSPAFKNPAELPNQVKYVRGNPRVQGSVYFSSNSLTSNLLGFTDSLRRNYYRKPALPPPMLWRDSIAPNTPTLLTAVSNPRGVILNWQTPAMAKDNEPVYGYVVYRFSEAEKIDIDDAEHILFVKYNPETSLLDNTAEKGKKYIYVVTAIDRMKNESEHSEPVTITLE